MLLVTFVSGRVTQVDSHRGFPQPQPTAIFSIVCQVHASMLFAKVAVFLVTSFLWDSGTIFSTRLLCTLFLAVQSFLVARGIRFLRSFLTTYALDSDSLERQKE